MPPAGHWLFVAAEDAHGQRSYNAATSPGAHEFSLRRTAISPPPPPSVSPPPQGYWQYFSAAPQLTLPDDQSHSQLQTSFYPGAVQGNVIPQVAQINAQIAASPQLQGHANGPTNIDPSISNSNSNPAVNHDVNYQVASPLPRPAAQSDYERELAEVEAHNRLVLAEEARVQAERDAIAAAQQEAVRQQLAEAASEVVGEMAGRVVGSVQQKYGDEAAGVLASAIEGSAPGPEASNPAATAEAGYQETAYIPASPGQGTGTIFVDSDAAAAPIESPRPQLPGANFIVYQADTETHLNGYASPPPAPARIQTLSPAYVVQPPAVQVAGGQWHFIPDIKEIPPVSFNPYQVPPASQTQPVAGPPPPDATPAVPEKQGMPSLSDSSSDTPATAVPVAAAPTPVIRFETDSERCARIGHDPSDTRYSVLGKGHSFDRL